MLPNRLPRGFPVWAAVTFLAGFAVAIAAGEALIQRNDSDIRITAPEFHFLEGRPLERAKDGQSILYVVQMQLSAGSRTAPAARNGYSFWVSYDLWEERFVVTNRKERASFRTTAEAEAWCLARSPISVNQALRNQPLWLKLEVWASDTDAAREPMFTDQGIDIRTLIDVFSRNPKRNQRWTLERGPFRWEELKQGS